MSDIRHLISPDDNQRTLCGRKRSYGVSTITLERVRENRLPSYERFCSRCRGRAEREGLLLPAGVNADGSVDHEAVSSGDKHHDNWLSRLGVC